MKKIWKKIKNELTIGAMVFSMILDYMILN